ncbi:hypothetical protein [Bacillus suaedae]|uniref:Uncharacterized protein n=1 Tax=Halalkalibacter suaedae TaxID=2822140 RepID=A0A941AQP9_9BACI|nr:hypothetical protein [Bacillus suaedae]MBP3951478.1 hypothetical protein [Bacillus suaedae]
MTFNAERYHSIIDKVVIQIYNKYPEIEEVFGDRGKIKCKEDNVHHFHYLETADHLNQPRIFTDYALWLNNILVKRGMSSEHLIDNFRFIQIAIKGNLEEETVERFSQYLDAAIDLINSPKGENTD